MQRELEDLMAAAASHADYADARHVRRQSEHVATRNGELAELDASDSLGTGVRVRVSGRWGFASTRGESREELEAALSRALAIARAQPAGRTARGELAPEPPARGSYASDCERDPFTVPLEEKLELLTAADAAMRAERGVTVANAHVSSHRTETVFASTEGALYEQRLTECGGGVAAVAAGQGQTQVRSFPASHDGDVAQAGFEHVLALGLVEAAPRVAEEAVALLRAQPCVDDRTTLILAGEQLQIQLHESIGHALELDRMLGLEASYAGTSYADPAALGRQRLGSALLNVTADATTPGGLGSFRWDDEGVEAQVLPLVREGVIAGAMSSRETAVERSGGCMRAEGFSRQPIVRMTNVHLDPGEAGTLEDLIADTDRGILIETNRSWSIDARREQFRFAGEAAWEIRNGRRHQLLRDPYYEGRTADFWSSLDAVCSQSDWRMLGLVNCGKGEPGQAMHVSHGCAPARFRDVSVGMA